VRIKDQSLQQVTSAALVAEVVGDFVTLKRRGRNLIACCPFHDEKSPSFNVNPERGIYKCFGCGKSGDSITFVMEIEALTFVQAIEYLARKYNIALEYEQGSYDQDSETAREREGLMLALQAAQTWYRGQLTDSTQGQTIALPYLKERGVLVHIQEEFGVGWAPDAYDTFAKYALGQGFKPEILEAAGLCLQREDGSLYDRFRARVMFPIYTPSGRVAGFGGRILGKDPKLAKYVNSPESAVYQKSKILYGLWQSRQDIRKQNQVFLTEGYLDVIALHQAGIARAVASSGTSLTLEQARLITRYAENVTVLFDGDAAGTKAALRGIDILLEEGLAVRVLLLPDNHDPDSYLKAHGSEAFLAYTKAHEKDFVTFKAEILLEEAGSDPFKKAEAAAEVVRTISLMPDRMKQDILLKQAARLLGMSEETLRSEAARMENARARERDRQADRDKRRTGSAGQISEKPAPSTYTGLPPGLELPPGIAPAPADETRQPPALPPAYDDWNPHADITDFAPQTESAATIKYGPGPSSQAELGALLDSMSAADQLALQEREAIRLLLNQGTTPLGEGRLVDYILGEVEGIVFTSEPAPSTLKAI